MWKALLSSKSPELASLAASVQGSVLHSRASSTTEKYLAAFRHWKEWDQQHSLKVFPVKEAQLVLYMPNVADSTRSKAAVEKSYNDMAWIHVIGDYHSPTESKFVRQCCKVYRGVWPSQLSKSYQ